MTNCVNINHPEIERLSNETGLSKSVIATKVSIWQDDNASNEFPSSSELTKVEVNSELNFMSVEQQDKLRKGISNFLITDGDYIFTQRKQKQIVGIVKSSMLDTFNEYSKNNEELNVKKAKEIVLEGLQEHADNIKELSKITNQEQLDNILQENDLEGLMGMTVEQIQSLDKEMDIILKPNVLEQLFKFTFTELRTLGLNFKNPNSNTEVIENNVDPSEEDLDSDEGGYERTSYADEAVFQIDIRDTASWRIKSLLSTIIDTGTSFYGLPTYKSTDEVFNDVMTILSQVQVRSLSNFIEALKKERITNPKKSYLDQVIDILVNADTDVRIKNEFVTVFNKYYNNQIVTVYSKTKKGWQIYTIDSDSNTLEKQMLEVWIEGFKESNLVKANEEGELSVNKELANNYKKRLIEINKITVQNIRNKEEKSRILDEKRQLQISFARDLFQDLGMVLNDETFTVLLDDSVYKESGRRFNLPMSFTGQFKYIEEKGSSLGLFSHIINSLTKTPEVTEEDTESILKNNPFVGEESEKSVTKFLAKVVSKYSTNLYTNSFKNAEGKSVYSYGMPTWEAIKLNELKNEESTRLMYSKHLFSDGSNWLTEGIAFWNNLNYSYLDGLKINKGKTNKGTKRTAMSLREMNLVELNLFLNRNAFVGLTHSDKSTTPIVELDSVLDVVNRNYLNVKGKGNDAYIEADYIDGSTLDVFNKIVKAEANRILYVLNNTQTEEQTKEFIKKEGEKFVEGGKYFFLFPELNKLVKDENGEVDFNKVAKIALSDVIHESVLNTLVDEINGTVKELLANDIVKFNTLDDGGTALSMRIQSKKIKDLDKLQGITEEGKLFHIAANYSLNAMLTNINMMMLVHGDPAQFFKKDIETTLAEYEKRLAKDIAPGSIGNTDWNVRIGDKQYSGNSTYNVVYANDPKIKMEHEGYIKKIKAYNEIKSSTDAQEYTTLEEHINTMMNQGLIPTNVYVSIMGKIESNRGGIYNLSETEKKVILQARKPVQVTSKTNGKTIRNVYIKTSSFPLIPELTAGTELDKLRVAMETQGVDRIAFMTGVKVGGLQPMQIFNGSNIKSDLNLKDNIDVLDRKNFSIQQEIPYEESKHEIRLITQMNKLLFAGLLDYDFNFNGKTIKGKDFKNLKENVRIELYKIGEKALYEELGITVTEDGNFKISKEGFKKIQEAIKEEAIGRNWYINDITALELNENQDGFLVPLSFNNNADKVESLLLSIIENRIIKQKQQGKSLIQASSAGVKIESWNAEKLKDSGIVFIQSFIENNLSKGKGLNYINVNEDGSTQVAQVILPFKFFNNKGELLHVEDFMKDGYLDMDKVPQELLRLIGARIPNQGHSSQLAIEVVGFLPHNMGDLVLVPAEITVQMGSDFDIDKLYTYMNKTILNEDGKLISLPYHLIIGEDRKSLKEIDEKELNKFILENFKSFKGLFKVQQDDNFIDNSFASEETLEVEEKSELPINITKKDLLQQLYFEIHYNVLSNKEVIKKCLTPLDKSDLEEIGNLVTNKKSKSIYASARRQKAQFISQKAGKSGVGVFSRAVVTLAIIEDKNLKLVKPLTFFGEENENGEIIPIELNNLSGEGYSEFNGETRTKQDNIITQQNGSVDNAKNPVLDNNNLNNTTFNVSIAMSILSDNNKKALNLKYNGYFLQQQIIKDFVRAMSNINDGMNDEFVKDKKEVVVSNLHKKYLALAKAEGTKEYFEELEKEILSINSLEKLLLTPKNEKTTDYYKSQINILQKFLVLDEIGKEFSEIAGAISTDSKGYGKNVYDVLNKAEQLSRLENKKYITGGETVLKNDDTISEVGYVAETVRNTVKILDNFFLYNAKQVKQITKEIEELTGKNNSTKIDTDFKKEVFQDIKSYVFSNPELGFEQYLSDLLMDKVEKDKTYTKKSLAKRVKDAQKSWGRNNMFLQMLVTDLSKKAGVDPSLIKFKAFTSDRLDMSEVVTSFIDMLVSTDPIKIGLAEDLVAYTYLTGGVQGANEFVKQIPSVYLDKIPFAQRLQELETEIALNEGNSINKDIFIKQFAQHNPGDLKQVFQFNVKIDKVVINTAKDDITNLLIDSFDINGNPIQYLPEFVGFRDSGNKVHCYQQTSIDKDIATYTEIPVLGGVNHKNPYFKEFSWDNYNTTSNFSKNNPVVKKTKPTANKVVGTDKINNVTNQVEGVIHSYTNGKNETTLEEVLNNFENDEFKLLRDSLFLSNKLDLKSITFKIDYKIDSAGKFKDNVVYINPKLLKDYLKGNNHGLSSYHIERIIAHEALHALTMKQLKDVLIWNRNLSKYVVNPNNTNTESKRIANELITLFDYVSKNKEQVLNKMQITGVADDYTYGFKNAMEFVAEVFTSKSFRDVLSKIEYKTDISVWDKIKSILQRFFNQFVDMYKLQPNEQNALNAAIVNGLELINLESNTVGEVSKNEELNFTSLGKSVQEFMKNDLTLEDRRTFANMLRNKEITFKCN